MHQHKHKQQSTKKYYWSIKWHNNRNNNDRLLILLQTTFYDFVSITCAAMHALHSVVSYQTDFISLDFYRVSVCCRCLVKLIWSIHGSNSLAVNGSEHRVVMIHVCANLHCFMHLANVMQFQEWPVISRNIRMHSDWLWCRHLVHVKLGKCSDAVQ